MVNNSNQSVLIVDDEDLARTLLSQVLESTNVSSWNILLAEDGPEAVRLAEQERPALILLDLLLPTMSGVDACQYIRSIPDYDPYIIVLTARGDRLGRQQAEHSGANYFMTKPFNRSVLITIVNQLSENYVS